MSLINAQKLKAALPRCRNPDMWANALNPAMEKYSINTKPRIASFLAQIGHESAELNVLEENLNYSAKGLMANFPKRFPTLQLAEAYARNPEKIGNYIYANRIGNGPQESGDGYRYRGRGLIQLTGRSNYFTAGKILGIDLINFPEKLLDPHIAAMSAAWFWASRGLNELADDESDDDDLEDFIAITKRINGGTKGLADRLSLLNSAMAAV